MRKKAAKRAKKLPLPGKPRRDAKRRAAEPARRTAGDPPDRDVPVVGIGASAGGLEALEALLKNLPANPGMAFVVVTHQHPSHTSMLPELLARSCTVPVVVAVEGARLAANHVYVAPPGARLEIVKGHLHVLEPKDADAPRLPIDFFFRSLAQDKMEKAVCIVLSGNGTDGTLGLRAIKGESGMVMVQEPKSAKYDGMPSSAIATGLADYVLPPAKMAEQLVAYARGPYLRGARLTEAPPETNEPIQKILVLLRARTRHDFSSYKPSTVRRRIERRMNVHQIKDLGTYLRLLHENPREVDVLFQELLISVTSFFRDADAYEALAKKVLPELVRRCGDHDTLRVWVPGCSTGEEAYSLAILLRETMEKLRRRVDVQIFATDLDRNAIDRARAGVYPDGIGVDVDGPRLEKHFVREDGGYRVRKELREMVIFAPQSVISDPPFTKLDLISCRNVLIYFDGPLQKRLIPTFHYALKPGGILFLGPSETATNFGDLFEPLDAKWKIFRRREASGVGHALELPPRHADIGPARREVPARGALGVPPMFAVLEKALLERFAPASVIVDDRGDILYIHGRTGAYLEPSAGQPRLNVLEMAREGLEPALSSLMRDARARDNDVGCDHVAVKANGSLEQVDLTASVLREPETVRGLLLITFRPAAPSSSKPKKGGPRSRKNAGTHDLERELQHTKESLRSTVEELETSNEELKSANEELQSMNEELQSTNEELETSKEEMQSLNEELTTVNTELQSKLDDLARVNDDMQNLFNAADVATIFVDNDLRIKRYTEQATKMIKLIPTDIGRPLGDLMTNLKREGLLEAAREVLHSLVYKEIEVQTEDDRWYLLRLAPYRTSDNRIDGLVITFVDIDHLLKHTQSGQAERSRLLASLIEGMGRPVLVVDPEQRVVAFNRLFHEAFRLQPGELGGKLLGEAGEGPWTRPELTRVLRRAAAAGTALPELRLDGSFGRLGRRSFVARGWPLDRGSAKGSFLLEMEDVTDAEAPSE